MDPDREVRHLAGLRAETVGGTPRLVGYAIRTDTLSAPLAGGLFRETITPAAVRAALAANPDLVALVNHDHGRVVGRQSAKTLRVEQDDQGLRFEVDLPAHEAGLAESVARGDLPYASFEFHRAKDELDRTTTPPTRTIHDFRIREISVGVPFPAYEATSVAVVRSLEEPMATPAPVADPVPPVAPDLHLESELRQFSLRALLAGAAGIPGAEWGRERELSQEVARRSGRPFRGHAVPMSVFEQRVVTTALPAGGPGGNVIATDFRGDQYIDRLRAALRIRQLGARVLTGLTGNVAIPKLSVSATGAWVAENVALTPSDPELVQVTLVPHHVGSVVEYSRNMLLQTSSPEIEDLLRDDMAKVLARAIDAAAINGSGDAPTGILGTSGIGDVSLGAAGGQPTWASIVNLIAAVEIDDAVGTGFLGNPKVTAKLRQTVVLAGGTDSTMIMMAPDRLAGYPYVATTLVPSTLTEGASGAVLSALIFGNWSDLLLGFWSELDVLVNPYESTAYLKGNVQIRAFATCDLKLRHAESFAAILDMITT